MSFGPFDADRSAPPLVPLALAFLSRHGGLEFASEALPQVARAHRWLMARREPRRDGLLCWGDDPEKIGPIRIDGWAGAAYESGMDDSPLWEDLAFDPASHSLGRGCVDLTSLAALSARVLAHLSRSTDVDPTSFEQDFRRIRVAANLRLWSDDGLYRNLRLDDSLSSRIGPTSFYPLLAGLVPRDRAEILVRMHLLNPEEFGGPYVIPSIARNDRAFNPDGDYWRGRIWPPINFLVWAGLRQYDGGASAHLASASRELFDIEWGRRGHIHENYSALTGEGRPGRGIYARSCPFYCWGGLLLLPAAEEEGQFVLEDIPIPGGE
jgi:glycogen debranching enzyme